MRRKKKNRQNWQNGVVMRYTNKTLRTTVTASHVSFVNMPFSHLAYENIKKES